MPTTYIKSLPDWLSSRLAPEVYDVILDHLHTSKQDLSACSLVCRSWLPVCRYHLFGEMNYSADLARVIERSTHAHSAIVPYIRKVTIQGFNPLSNATKEKRMIFILNLPNLHHLHIEKCDWSRWGFPTSLSLDTPSVCRLSTLHLRSVHFPSFATLANFLDQFITLQNLSLDSLSWNELTYNSGQYGFLRTSVLKPSTLRKLHIVFCHNIVVLNWLQYGVISDGVLGGDLIQHRIFSHLVSVVVPDIQPTEATTFRAFIVTLGEPLEHLEMGILLQDHGGPNQSGTHSTVLLFSSKVPRLNKKTKFTRLLRCARPIFYYEAEDLSHPSNYPVPISCPRESERRIHPHCDPLSVRVATFAFIHRSIYQYVTRRVSHLDK